MTERDRSERSWLESEVSMAATLTDADRVRILRDLLRTAAAIQATKSPEQLKREEEVRDQLDRKPGRENYLATIERLA